MKMIFGGIYERKNRCYSDLNSQRYDIYIPAAYKDKDGEIMYKMVDTYMVRNPCWGKVDMEKRLWFLEQANCGETSWEIFFGHNDYFYQNIVKLPTDELDEKDWELIADLHDYVMVGDDESNDYLEEDLLKYIPLWNEDTFRWHGYGVGKIYLRKGAKKDGWKRYCNALSQYNYGMTGDWKLNSLEKECKDILENMSLGYGKKKKIRNTLKEIRKYRKLSKEFYDFREKLKHPKKK